MNVSNYIVIKDIFETILKRIPTDSESAKYSKLIDDRHSTNYIRKLLKDTEEFKEISCPKSVSKKSSKTKQLLDFIDKRFPNKPSSRITQEAICACVFKTSCSAMKTALYFLPEKQWDVFVKSDDVDLLQYQYVLAVDEKFVILKEFDEYFFRYDKIETKHFSFHRNKKRETNFSPSEELFQTFVNSNLNFLNPFAVHDLHCDEFDLTLLLHNFEFKLNDYESHLAVYWQVGNIDVLLEMTTYIDTIVKTYPTTVFYFAVNNKSNVYKLYDIAIAKKLKFRITITENKGMDINMFLTSFAETIQSCLKNHKLILKIHTKTDKRERDSMMKFVSNHDNLKSSVHLLNCKDVGVVGTIEHKWPKDKHPENKSISQRNEKQIIQFFNKLGLGFDFYEHHTFFAGTFFMCKPKILYLLIKSLQEYLITFEKDFNYGKPGEDCFIEHAWERIITMWFHLHGYKISGV